MEETLESLESRKTAFLDTVEIDIYNYIVGTGRQCIAIVQLSRDNIIRCTWRPDLDDDLGHYCKVLYKFVRKQPYKGSDLDSALTEPISNLVEAHYQSFYTQESDAISQGVLVELTRDEAKLQNMADMVADIAMKNLSKQARKQIAHLVVEHVKQSISQGTLHTIGQNISHVASTAAGTQIAVIIAHMLVKLLATHICQIVAKLLASAMIKNVIMLLVKKFVVVAVLGAVVKFLAIHVSIAVGGSSVMFIVLPLLIAYIGYKVATFPEKIGEEVSHSVRAKLAEKFTSINKGVLEKVLEVVFEGDKLVKVITEDPEFQALTKRLEGDA